MTTLAWALIFRLSANDGSTVVDDLASKHACEFLKAKIHARKAKCVQYEIAKGPPVALNK